MICSCIIFTTHSIEILELLLTSKYNHQSEICYLHRANGKIEKSNTSVEDVASWLNGDLLFDQATPAEVFATLARRFDVEFKYQEADFEGCTLTAKFPNQHLKVIMKTIGNSLDFKYSENGSTIEITGGQPCR